MTMKKKSNGTFVSLLGALVFCASVLAGEALTSPGGSIRVEVETDRWAPTWSVSRKGIEIIKPSKLGLDFIGEDRWGNFKLKKAERREIDSSWSTHLYKKETIRDRANEMTLDLEDAKGRLLTLVFRAYDEGVAFRYVVPEQKAFDGFQLRGEFTEWRFAEGVSGWLTSYKSFVDGQEEAFDYRKISDVGEKELIGMPAVIQVGSQRVALCEADLTNWAGMTFRVPKGGQKKGESKLEAAIAPLPAISASSFGVAVTRMTPAASPWRVMICADSDADLVANNDIIQNLNPPPEAGMDFSWVKPGASSWDWWVESNNSLSTELTIDLIDFAAEMGWEYHTIDGGWYGWARRPSNGPEVKIEPRKTFDLHKVLAHAKEKGVGIWVWLHWLALEENGVDETFEKLAKWGIKGVKIDFLERMDQRMVRWYESTIRLAAKHKLMVNYHGAYKPTGMNRTWPNQITREGIRGNEMLKFHSTITPQHCATLPFTRFLLGPGDFTPGGFGNVHTEKFVPQSKRGHRYGDESDRREIWAEEIGTRAHALALCIAYESPIMTLCDWPKRYRGAKGIEALRNLPTVWRNTKVITGETGKAYVVVRETFDGRFYIAALGVDAQKIEVPLSFLPAGKEFEGAFYEDGPNAATDATNLAETKRIVTRESKVTLNLAREGGAVVIFKSVK